MPEFPEVYTIVSDLKKHLENSHITKIEVSPYYKIKSESDEFILEHITGAEIKSITQQGKYILFDLDKFTLVIHLGMTGKLLIRSPGFNGDKHVRVLFSLVKNNIELELRFIDIRMFGKVMLLTRTGATKLVNKLGPNLLSNALSYENFYAIIKSKKTNIKNVLMDQEKISGMGNVYVTDALWIAKIHPLRPTSSINKEDASKLLDACREILQEGIKNRGLTISDYVDAFGKPGYQQNYFRIYRREKCQSCKGLVSILTINARSTYFCNNCQK